MSYTFILFEFQGFGGGRDLTPSPDIRNAYFSVGDYNILIVDYGPAVKEPCLNQIEWGPRFASLCIAQMIKYIAHHPRGVAPDYMHVSRWIFEYG